MEHPAVAPGPHAAVGPQLEVALGDAQIHQGKGPAPGEPGLDGAVGPELEAVPLSVHGRGGPLHGGDAGVKPGRRRVRRQGQLPGGPQGPGGRTSLGNAHRRHAHQGLPRLQLGQTGLPVIGPAHPAGPQPHGRGGEDQLLSPVAALLLQIRILRRTGQQEILPGPLQTPLARKGRDLGTHQPEMQPGAAAALRQGLAQLLPLDLLHGTGQIGPLGAADPNSFQQIHGSSFPDGPTGRRRRMFQPLKKGKNRHYILFSTKGAGLSR